MPRGRRASASAPSTVRFIALLRGLGLAVAAYGVSHAQIERRLCARIADGQKAMALQGDGSGEADQRELRQLIARKVAAEESGLARTDGRRDRAGGQRIGELLAGKLPRGAMPPRGRVEVCVDVILEILEEKDPAGYADGRYGSRQEWQSLWLQADQGRMPALGPAATTVLGYLDVATRQLAGAEPADGSSDTGDPGVVVAEPAPPAIPAAGTTERVGGNADAGRRSAGRAGLAGVGTAEQVQQRRRELTAAQGDAEELVETVRAERDDALQRAVAAEQAEQSAQREVARLRDELDQRRLAGARMRRISASTVVLALACTAAGLVLVNTGVIRAPSTHTVQLAYPPQSLGPDDRATFAFSPLLPANREWTLHLRLTITPTNPSAGCTYGAQLTFHIETDGHELPSFTSAPSQKVITQEIHLGQQGAQDLRLVITRLVTDPGCKLMVSPAGSQAISTS